MTTRPDRHIVSVAVIVAVGNPDGRRRVLGMMVGHSSAEWFGVEFLCSPAHRGWQGVKLVFSDAHEGLTAAVAMVIDATSQRCRAHYADLGIVPTCRREPDPGAVITVPGADTIQVPTGTPEPDRPLRLA